MSSQEFALTKPRAIRWEGLDITLNPAVVLIVLSTIWPLIVWLGAEPEESTGELWWWKRRIEVAFIWLYYAVRNVWVIFLGWLYFSRFGKYVLGESQEDTAKEYSDCSWATMMFSTGMFIALFYFGVSEPVFHFHQSMQSDQRRQSFLSVDMSSQEGILLTFFNFGVHAWAPFVLIAVAVAWAHYRHGHPFAMRSAFFPLLGEKINGWFGDVIDIMTCLATFMGMAMAMGLVGIMVSAGMNFLDPFNAWIGIGKERNIQNYETMCGVVLVTAAGAIISVLFGMHIGMRSVTGLAALFSAWVMLAVFFMDDSWYQLNVFTQSIGYYLFYIVKLGHHVDAFQKSDSGVDQGKAPILSPWFDSWQGDGAQQGWVDNKAVNPAGRTNSNWDSANMVGIYWGWWISMAPLVGIFMAKISRGRTIKSVIHWGLGFPVLVCFAWISVFGGLGIKMERRAIIDGCRCGCEVINGGYAFDRRFCALVGANQNGQTALSLYYEGSHKGEEKPNMNPGGAVTCDMVRPPVRGELGGCDSIVQLSTLRPERRWFALLDEYMTGNWYNGAKNMGRFLSGVTIAALICWLIAIMDTGCFVIDQILSNGEDKPHRIWRILMLLTAVALTCLLLYAGAGAPSSNGNGRRDWDQMYDAAVALQVVSFIMGMLLTVFLTALPVTIYRALDDEEDDALHPAVIALGHPGNEKTNLPAFTTCGDVERTRGHPLTYVDIWTTEEIQEPIFDRKRIINRWTQSLDGGILNILDIIAGSSARDLPPIGREFPHIASCIVAPFIMLGKGYDKINKIRHMEKETEFIFGLPIYPFIVGTAFLTWTAWISLLIVETATYWYNGDNTGKNNGKPGWTNGDEGMWALAWICYVFFAFLIACCRYNVRQILRIKGNLVQDFFLSLLFYPFVIAQIDSQRLPRVAPTPAKIDVVHVVPKAVGQQYPSAMGMGMPMMGMGMHGTAQMPMMGTAQMPMM